MVLGLDLSLTETGWCFLAPGIERTGTLKPDGRTGVERLRFLKHRLYNLVRDCNELQPIQQVVLEGYSFGSKNQREAMGEWGGVARLALADMNLNVSVFQPTSLKFFVTGNGQAKKDAMMLQIYKRWGREFSNNNIADAFALAAVALAISGEGTYQRFFGQELTQKQSTALQKIAVVNKSTSGNLGAVRVRTRGKTPTA